MQYILGRGLRHIFLERLSPHRTGLEESHQTDSIPASGGCVRQGDEFQVVYFLVA